MVTRSNEIWDRTGPNTMSKNLFVLCLTAFTVAGLVFAGLMARVSLHWTFSNKWLFIGFLVAVLVVSFLGIYIFTKYDNPVVSLFGYALMAGPLGLMLGPVLAMYSPAIVVKAFAITSALVIILGIIGAVIPDSLEKWYGWLMSALILLILGQFAIPIFGFFGLNMEGALTFWDWVGIIVFSAWVIFDLNRAMHMNYTLDNAVDAAAGIFLDFLNLLIRIAELLGRD